MHREETKFCGVVYCILGLALIVTLFMNGFNWLGLIIAVVFIAAGMSAHFKDDF